MNPILQKSWAENEKLRWANIPVAGLFHIGLVGWDWSKGPNLSDLVRRVRCLSDRMKRALSDEELIELCRQMTRTEADPTNSVRECTVC